MTQDPREFISVIGETNFRDQRVQFGLRPADRRRHLYIVGKTGMGKSALLFNLACQDIEAGHGLCIIDPHGDLALSLLNRVPTHRSNDVIYFNAADYAYPIAWNPLEKVPPDRHHLVVSSMISVFQRLWSDSWGPRLEHILRSILFTLLRMPGATLLGVQRILTDQAYRKRLVRALDDPYLKRFWVEEAPTYFTGNIQAESLSPILNKVGQFLAAPLMRNILGQPTSAIDLRDVIDSKKVLIVNLAKGEIGEDNARLLGALIVTKLQLAAMSRSNIAEDDRVDFYLYVDEFQNYATDSFAGILSEARKYRLNLILAHQFLDQLPESVRQAVFGNVGSVVSFQVGPDDALLLAAQFGDIFGESDLMSLPRYHIYLRLLIDGSVSSAFSATTLPPLPRTEACADPATLIRISRERYSTPRVVVEDRLSRWFRLSTDANGEGQSVPLARLVKNKKRLLVSPPENLDSGSTEEAGPHACPAASTEPDPGSARPDDLGSDAVS